MHGHRRRERRRRWVARRRVVGGTAPSPVTALVERAGLEIRRVGPDLTVEVVDYHARPMHLDTGDLATLGLAPAGSDSARPASVAVAWLAVARVQPDRARRGPGLDVGWSLPPGLRRSDLLLARVKGGLDIFVLGYDARPVRLTPEDLRQLKLSPVPPS